MPTKNTTPAVDLIESARTALYPPSQTWLNLLPSCMGFLPHLIAFFQIPHPKVLTTSNSLRMAFGLVYIFHIETFENLLNISLLVHGDDMGFPFYLKFPSKAIVQLFEITHF